MDGPVIGIISAIGFPALVIGALLIWWFFPAGLWIAATSSGVPIFPLTLITMRLRGVNQASVVNPLIQAHKAGLSLSLDGLEAHCLAGGNVQGIVNALISANKAGISLECARTVSSSRRRPSSRFAPSSPP